MTKVKWQRLNYQWSLQRNTVMLKPRVSRFLAVVFPVSSLTLRTASNAKHLILATWVTVLAASVPIYMTHNILKIDNGKFVN